VTVLCSQRSCRFPITVPAAVLGVLGSVASSAALIRAANAQIDPTSHVVYTVKAGMPSRAVVALLGPPTSVLGDRWLYRHVPPGGSSCVVLAGGVVDAMAVDAGSTPHIRWCSGRGTVDPSRSEDALVEQLVSIARGRGFLLRASGSVDRDTVHIGRLLHARGGTSLMRRVHSAVAARVRHRSVELNLAWDGIGDW